MGRLPTDAQERKQIPLWSGLFKYFPDALIAVAKLSYIGNNQHNPGKPLHWSREKSSDHEDTLLRHLMESGTVDTDGVRHSTKLVWRALAKLQLEIEAAVSLEETEATARANRDVIRAAVVAEMLGPTTTSFPRTCYRISDPARIFPCKVHL